MKIQGKSAFCRKQTLKTLNMLRRRVKLGLLTLIALSLNLHYPLLSIAGMGWPLGLLAEGLFSSRYLLGTINALWTRSIEKGMLSGGIPAPNRTVVVDNDFKMDVYDFAQPSTSAKRLRPAVLYFHAGAFSTGGRCFGAGTMAWLAAHGYVGLTASYTLTSSGVWGSGVVTCIEDAWRALRWTQAHAHEIGVDARKIIVAGDSAGGGLALALATRLGAAASDDDARPAAVFVGWAVTDLDPVWFGTVKAANGTWGPTPAADEFETPNVFVPQTTGPTAAAAQRQLQRVFSGSLLLYGRSWLGWLPASAFAPAVEEAAAAAAAALISPMSRASERGMPPVLMMVGAADEVVPAGQQERFAETARRSGNRVAVLRFQGSGHGGGGVNCQVGREAVLRFLEANDLGARATAAQPHADRFVEVAKHAFGVNSDEYQPLPPLWRGRRGTVTLKSIGRVVGG